MTRRWVVLEHVAWEGPGLIAAEARAHGFALDLRRLDLGASVPEPDDVTGLIVMGGPMGVYEAGKYPFLADECRLIAALVERRYPVLGVCLGAQLLASALGAKVFPGHGEKIGFGSVDLTPAGKQDRGLGPVGPSLPVFHWHGDTFDLPEGATLLASSAAYRHQAFRIGSCAYGLQFHLEPDAETWAAWQGHLPSSLAVRSTDEQRGVARAGRSVVRRFFDLALAEASALGKSSCA